MAQIPSAAVTGYRRIGMPTRPISNKSASPLRFWTCAGIPSCTDSHVTCPAKGIRTRLLRSRLICSQLLFYLVHHAKSMPSRSALDTMNCRTCGAVISRLALGVCRPISGRDEGGVSTFASGARSIASFPSTSRLSVSAPALSNSNAASPWPSAIAMAKGQSAKSSQSETHTANQAAPPPVHILRNRRGTEY